MCPEGTIPVGSVSWEGSHLRRQRDRMAAVSPLPPPDPQYASVFLCSQNHDTGSCLWLDPWSPGLSGALWMQPSHLPVWKWEAEGGRCSQSGSGVIIHTQTHLMSE